jgi:hypothetical protein
MEDWRACLMKERLDPVLRIICLGLAALLVYQLARLVLRRDPLAKLTFPATTALASSPEPQTAKQGTNVVARQGPPKKTPEVPSAIQARVDRITQSEILAPVVRPLPMALLGIAGKDAFLRAPNGQTGLLREGEELGGVKLLRIGTNRVLVEQDGLKKELTVFSGLGGENLLPDGKEKSQ